MTARFFQSNPWGRAAALLAGLLLSAILAHGQGYSAAASFNPSPLVASQPGYFQVSVTITSPTGDTLTPDCTPPAVDGLQMTYAGIGNSLQSTTITNGIVSRLVSFSIIFNVRADKPGHYAVPAFDIMINKTKVPIAASSLDVTEKPVAPPASEIVGLAATLPRKEIYVGEKIPLDLSVYWRSDLSLQTNGELEQDNDAFERIQLKGRGNSVPISRNSRSYASNVWRTMIVPLKSGPQKLSFSLPLVVTFPDPNGIADPMISQMLGANSPFVVGQQKTITAQSPELELNVQSLPIEGKPEHFTGGIGTFSADEPSLSTIKLQVGVPVTLTVKVSGEGNFDRLNAPVLDLGSLWRTYPTKDSFKPQDADGYRGIKTFEYVIMPMSDNITSLPAPDVNFFNPETKAYVALPLKPISVIVKAADPGQAAPPLPALAAAPTTSDKSELVPLRLDAGSWQNTQPGLIFTSPVFWASQAAPAILLGALVVTRRRQLRIETDPAFARRLRARQQAPLAVAQARAAATKGHATEFYAAAQRALQEAASHDRLDAAEALTWQEFDAHLAARGANVDVRQQSREIFDAGDALRFGGYSPDQASLAEAAARLDRLVQLLLGRA